MAHLEQKQFFEKVKNIKPEHFRNVRVLDIGSLDINGNLRSEFQNSIYVGVDVYHGRNVDVVGKGHEVKFDYLFDTVISAECFEHDMFYNLTIKNMYDHLRSGGLFAFTCASTGRPEHGTRRSKPEDAPLLTSMGTEWSDYYKNLTEEDIREVIDVDALFSEYHFEYNDVAKDLYFYGIKR